MGSDNRFPHMLPLDRPVPGLAEPDRRYAHAAAGAVCRRTGARACYDTRRGRVYFYLEEMDRGVLAVPFLRGDGHRERIGDSHRIDDMVLYIQTGRQPRRVKDRIIAGHEQRERWAKQDAIDAELEDRRPEALDRLRYRRQAEGMGTHWRKSAVVNGLRG